MMKVSSELDDDATSPSIAEEEVVATAVVPLVVEQAPAPTVTDEVHAREGVSPSFYEKINKISLISCF